MRRKSCQCQGCKPNKKLTEELKDPLATYLHKDEIKVNVNILAKFRQAVIMALKKKRVDEDLKLEAQMQQKKKKLITQQKLSKFMSNSSSRLYPIKNNSNIHSAPQL